jgi:hypothetical protein
VLSSESDGTHLSSTQKNLTPERLSPRFIASFASALKKKEGVDPPEKAALSISPEDSFCSFILKKFSESLSAISRLL